MQHPEQAGAGGTGSRESSFCSWALPAKGIAVDLHLAVVERLNRDLIRALRSTGDEAEVGGVLLGTIQAGRRIVIEDFVPVVCEHESGPRYQLSRSDKLRLNLVIAVSQVENQDKRAVVGYYRTHNREGFGLDDEDAALAREYFSGRDSIFLLIKPSPTHINLGGFFFWNQEDVEREPALRFPFSRSKLRRGETIYPNPAPGESQIAPDRPAGISLPSYDIPVPPLSEAETVAINRRARWPWVVLAALIVATAGAGYHFLWRPPSVTKMPENVARLALRAQKENNLLHITWDTNSPLIRSATGGILSIVDGSLTKQLNLGVRQLRSGALVYSGVTGNVTLQLHVFSTEGEFTEAIRVIGSDSLAELSRPQDPQQQGRAEDAAIRSVTTGSNTRLLGRTAFSRPAAPAPMIVQQKPGADAAPSSDEPAPSLPAGQIADENRARPAAVAPGKLVEARPNLPETTTVREQPVSSSPGVPALSRDAVTESALARPEPIAPSISPIVTIDYIAPRPVHRVTPSVPSSLRPLVFDDVRIYVKVYIDDTGRVVRAHPLTDGAHHDYLANVALDAAREWRFEPARRDNHNVASETVLQFVFVRGMK